MTSWSITVEFNSSAPKIINQTSIILFFRRNRHAILDCSTAGNPPPTVRWSRRDPHNQYYLPVYMDLRVVLFDNGSLGFLPIRRTDWGVYACEAVNYLGVDVATWIVCVGSERKICLKYHCYWFVVLLCGRFLWGRTGSRWYHSTPTTAY